MLYYFPYQDIVESCMVKRSYSMSFVFFQYPTETYGYALLFSYQDIIESCMVKRSYSMSFVFFQYPTETYGYALLFSLSGYLGLYIVLTLVKSFGALIAVTGKLVLYSGVLHFYRAV